MDSIPNSAIAMAIGLLIVVWGFLLHMIMGQAPDAHLQFLLELMEAGDEPSAGSSPRGPSPGFHDDYGEETLRGTAPSSRDEVKRQSAQRIGREVPLLFATSLRGRGL